MFIKMLQMLSPLHTQHFKIASHMNLSDATASKHTSILTRIVIIEVSIKALQLTVHFYQRELKTCRL